MIRTFAHAFGTLLFDLARDPQQATSIADPAVEQKMFGHPARLMRENDAPGDQFQRLGIVTESVGK